MVYLPEFNRESFLLFDHNPAGATKLRDYSSGRERVLGQPRLQGILGGTVVGRTRFFVDPHRTKDDRYWNMRTQEFNLRHLSAARSVRASVIANGEQIKGGHVRNVTSGRALRGSRRQLQDYINEHEAEITTALLEKLPPRLRELGAHIRWVSPIAGDDYAEYRDADFLRAVELGDYASELASFWPSGGPSWDALAVTYDTDGRIRPGVILVEAKSHISEIYGIGCQANPASRDLIEKALAVAKQWCGASGDADWTGPLYQSANRLAHLYFIRERIKHTAWLVNLYFINDPIGPADQAAWEVELQKVKASLGLATTALPSVIELFLPALTSSEGYEPPEAGGDCQTKESESEALGTALTSCMLQHTFPKASGRITRRAAPSQYGPIVGWLSPSMTDPGFPMSHNGLNNSLANGENQSPVCGSGVWTHSY